MSGVNYHGWTHKPKIYGGTDPIPGGQAVYAIEVFEIDVPVVAGTPFEWEVPEDLDGDALVKVEAYVNTAGSGETIMVRNDTTATDMLSTAITIDTGDLNSKDAAVQPVVDAGASEVAWGDHLQIVVTTAGGAIGMGVILYFFAMTTRTIVLEGITGATGATGADGAPGGITDWTGEWVTATNYTADQSVSHLGSSYAAIDNHTSGATSEPGVGANWEDHWQLLASSPATAADVPIVDTGTYFTGTDVEAALQELGADVAAAGAADGWVDNSSVTWTYVSATSFKISTVNATTDFPKGTRIRLTQGAGFKYFVVADAVYSTDTTVTITGGSDYTLANAAIADNSFSYQANPQGYPGWFTYDCAPTGFSGTPTQRSSRFSVVGKTCTVYLDVFGTSNATTFGLTAPISYARSFEVFAAQGTNNSANPASPFVLAFGAAPSTALAVFRDWTGLVAFTNSGGKSVQVTAIYEI